MKNPKILTAKNEIKEIYNKHLWQLKLIEGIEDFHTFYIYHHTREL